MFLSVEHLADLTGYVRPSAQRKWLSQNGFRFWLRGDGSLAVLANQFNAPREKIHQWQPDLSALDAKR